jgi:hypothetical protein
MSRQRLARFQATDPTCAEQKKRDKQLLSQLKLDIAEFRHSHWPPEYLSQIRDLPIYRGTPDEVARYKAEWQPYFERAYAFYPEAQLAVDALPLPSTLGLPLFVDHAERLHLARTYAKESKSFGSVGALIDRCGLYSDAEQAAMHAWFEANPEGMLVAHRAFIDLRAYVFCLHPISKEPLLPERVRFYRTGLILATTADFEILDSREKPRKQRSDAYRDPLGVNSTWTVFGRAAFHIEIDDEMDATDV